MDRYLRNYPPVLNVNDVATILGVTDRTVRRLVNTGEITGIKIGRQIRVPKDKLIKYLETPTK